MKSLRLNQPKESEYLFLVADFCSPNDFPKLMYLEKSDLEDVIQNENLSSFSEANNKAMVNGEYGVVFNSLDSFYIMFLVSLIKVSQ